MPVDAEEKGILLDLVTGAGTLLDSLERLASAAAKAVAGTADSVIQCGVLVQEANRMPTITGTTDGVIRLLQWEREKAEGPVSEVLAGGHPVSVLQRSGDFRWPRYGGALQQAGFGSAMGMRLRVDQSEASREMQAALAFFARDAKAFPIQVIAKGRAFAGLAAKSLQMALDLHAAKAMATDLRSALDSRTSINVACGVIMAQNRCSYHEAFSILAKASSHRNIKVRRVAEGILENLPEGPPRAHFGS